MQKRKASSPVPVEGSRTSPREDPPRESGVDSHSQPPMPTVSVPAKEGARSSSREDTPSERANSHPRLSIFDYPDNSETLSNGTRLVSFIGEHGPDLASMIGVPLKVRLSLSDNNIIRFVVMSWELIQFIPIKCCHTQDIGIGLSQDNQDVWFVLLKRGDPKNAAVVKRIPAVHSGMPIEVDYTSTRPQTVVRTGVPIHAVLETSSRGRIINSNVGTVGFIKNNPSGTSLGSIPFHVVDGGGGIVSDVFDSSGVKVANTVFTNPGCDTGVIQFVVPVQPTPGGFRRAIRGEFVRKSRTRQSNPSVGQIRGETQDSVRIVGVDNAHSGDSGQLWVADSDGASVAVHLEGHDLSQGSAKGAPFNEFTFPGLCSP
jgi:hypothetical protein